MSEKVNLRLEISAQNSFIDKQLRFQMCITTYFKYVGFVFFAIINTLIYNNNVII